VKEVKAAVVPADDDRPGEEGGLPDEVLNSPSLPLTSTKSLSSSKKTGRSPLSDSDEILDGRSAASLLGGGEDVVMEEG